MISRCCLVKARKIASPSLAVSAYTADCDPQVKPHVAAASVTAAAQRISNGNAQLALELVGFNQDLAAAMQYVFGNAFVCKVRFTPASLLGLSFSTG